MAHRSWKVHAPRTTLPRRMLGRTGFEVAALGLGTGWIGKALGADPEAEDALAVAAIRHAIALGLDYVDTAPSYWGGASERRVGLALKDGWRERVRLATKVGTHPARYGDVDGDAIKWSLEQSLRVLHTDVLDVALVHDPQDLEPVMAPGGALEALEQLKQEGVIRAIGLGVANHQQVQCAIDSDRFDVILIPYAYNLLHTTATPLLRRAARYNVGCINASPFQQGLLAGLDPDEVNRRSMAAGALPVPLDDLERAHAIWRWTNEHGVDLRALAIQYCMRQPGFATTLIGPRTATEVEEDILAAVTPIPADHWQSLQEQIAPYLCD
jgi:D-threo-aldose 1-dehydrogenase